jgi:hypothetical protein
LDIEFNEWRLPFAQGFQIESFIVWGTCLPAFPEDANPDKSQRLCINHPAILAGQRRDPSFATNAKFLRFHNKNPENATLAKKEFYGTVMREYFIPP